MLKDPVKVVEYFSKIYIEEYWKRFCFTIDYQRAMTTISEGYNRFIQWQFRKLMEKGLLVKKPHHAPACPDCGPVAIDTSETDISRGGNAEVLEFTVLKFKISLEKDGKKMEVILPAATLRPETVFGVTNIWLNPDVEYVLAEVSSGDTAESESNTEPKSEVVKAGRKEVWLLSREAFDKLSYQKALPPVFKEKIYGKEIIGAEARAPYTGVSVPVLEAAFVDPSIATGVLMSVPAHAPFDWAALSDIQKKHPHLSHLKPISMIRAKLVSEEDIPAEFRHSSAKTVNAGKTGPKKSSGSGQQASSLSEHPAVRICQLLGVESQTDAKKLEVATEIIYKNEFHSGVLLENCGKFAGLKVSEVKDTLKKEFINEGYADIFFEFSEPVVCRCGKNVVIKRIPEQWFIAYSDSSLKEKTKEHIRNMTIVPKEYYESAPQVIDWFGDRACIRQGSWLGTEFPFKQKWIIEPISDSTLYPAYYIVSKYLNDGIISPDMMDDAFFDYVFLGKKEKIPESKCPADTLEKIRKDFEYWYPLDINLGGKEHKTVHFPVFLMNHIAIMETRDWPKGIFVHNWVTQKAGLKISKSKGGAEPIPNAARQYGVDAMRLYYAHAGAASSDIEWDPEVVLSYKARISKIWENILELNNIINPGDAGSSGNSPSHTEIKDIESSPNEQVSKEQVALRHIDRWLISRLQLSLGALAESWRKLDLRAVAQIAYFQMPADIKWYIRRGGSSKRAALEYLKKWAICLSPITPVIAEEAWQLINSAQGTTTTPEKWACSQRFPAPDVSKVSPEALEAEKFIEATLEDTGEIIKFRKVVPKRVILYTSPLWKQLVLIKAFEYMEEQLSAALQCTDRQAVEDALKKVKPSDFIKTMLAQPEIKPYTKEAPKYIQKALQDAKISLADSTRKETEDKDTPHIRYPRNFPEINVPPAYKVRQNLNEHELLIEAKSFFEKEFNCNV
ncbi:MAG: leucine--tRNA ligase, partial [Thermoplasmata archaeon]